MPRLDPARHEVKKAIEQVFEHEFHGSMLRIGDIQIGGQFSKGKHRLEIIGNLLYVDNIPQTINSGDLERIKDIIRQIRK